MPKKCTKTCAQCNKLFEKYTRLKFCCNECKEQYNIENKDSINKKISESRKLYLKNNPDSHVWKRKEKFKSKPCEYFKKMLRENNIEFIEEYSPLIDEGRMFSVDIAFPDKKIAVEINGNQHYNRDGTLKAYYKERHDLITSKGWKVIEIPYNVVYKIDIKTIFDDSFLNTDLSVYRRVKKQKPKSAFLENRNNEILLNKDKIINSGIDFSKFGWVNHVSLILNISPQKVNSWMKRNMLEFYENNCFKRKSRT